MCCDEYVPHIKGNYLECHEIYKIDIENHEFELVDVVCLCKKCHSYIHKGLLQQNLFKGIITKEYYQMIIDRGNRLLAEKGLTKQDLSPEEIRNPEWVLRYKGEIY